MRYYRNRKVAWIIVILVAALWVGTGFVLFANARDETANEIKRRGGREEKEWDTDIERNMKEDGKKRASQWVKGLYASLGAFQLHLSHRNLCIIQKMPQTALLGKLCVCVCAWRYRLQRSYQVLNASNLFSKTQSICLGALETKCWQTDTLGATVRRTNAWSSVPSDLFNSYNIEALHQGNCCC